MDERLASMLADVFGMRSSEIHVGLTRSDVDTWDSLKQMDLLLSLEKEYAISLQVAEIVRMTSVASIAEVLRQKGIALED